MGCRLKVLRRNAWKGTGRHIESTLKYLVLLKPFLILAIFMLVYASGAGSFAYASDPGWKMVSASPVSPDEARRMLAESAGLVTTSQQLRGMATSETEATPEIQELARGLKHDPKLIFDYVRNHIDYVPTFGSVNGATPTILAGRGNDWDQASLFIALMRASGHTANYRSGDVWYTVVDAASWLGVDENQDIVVQVFANGGIPIAKSTCGDYVRITRVWAKANIGGSDYVFDPAFKEYEYTTGIDLSQAMGYSQASFLASAMAGATIGSDYVKNMNEGNIRSNLENYSTNLVNHIKENYPNASVREIIGGRKIVYEELEEYPTTLPCAIQIENQTEWTEIPDNYRLKLGLQHEGIVWTFASYQIAGKRVTIFYTGTGNAPELKVDGTLIATGNSTNPGTIYGLTISVDHPYADQGGEYGDQDGIFKLKSGFSYSLITDFESVSKDLISARNKILTKNRHMGEPEQSDAVLGEALCVMGLTWLHECKLSDVLMAHLADVAYVHHHSVGMVAQEEGYYIDVKISGTSSTSIHGNQGDGWAWFRGKAGVGSALEHGMLEQLQGKDKPAASTVKLLGISNSNSKKTFYVDSRDKLDSLWNDGHGQLLNYTQSQIDKMGQTLEQGYKLILPEDAHIYLNDWRGAGYIKTYSDAQNASVGMTISGNYYGGYGGYQEPVNIPETHYQTTVSNPPPSKDIGKHTVPVKDPLDIASGAFLHNHTDLSLGKAEPLGLHFTRSYNSSANYEKRSLCYGWAHNYDIYLEAHSHGDPGLGARLPVDAASAITGCYVAFDLMNDHDDLQGWLITSIAQKWAIDQLIDNAVTIHLGGKSLEYIKLADGAYSPPPCVTTKLIDNGATFTLEERFDTSLDFNTENRITSWQDADGNPLTFTYSSGKLHNVQDAFGRTLTLGYDGDYISSVSDSTGRSVSYQYSGDDLTGYTDPEGHNWSYSYSDHRMETLTDPLSVVMATNVYDDLGRVKTQTNGNNKTYQFYFSTYRNIEEDPDGNPIIYYFDHDGRQISQEDALGNRSYTTYDGQGHVISVTDPRQNATQFEYDGDHNRIKMIDPLSHETTYTYDTQHRLTATTDPLNHTTHFHYDNEHHLTGTIVYPESDKQIETNATYYTNGLTHTATDGKGTINTMTYDAYGNVDTTQTGAQPAVDSDYDETGLMQSLTDQAASTTTFDYDDRGLLETRTDPLLKSVNFIYYNDGRVSAVTDRNGDVIGHTYTPSGKVDTITYTPSGGPPPFQVSYGYDVRDNLRTMQDSLGTTQYGYDEANRLTSVTDPHGFVTGYSYDEAGNLTTLTYPGNKTVSYTYDALNRLETVTIDWQGKTATYHYDNAGRLSELDHFNGTWVSFGYDNADRLTDVQNRKSDTSAIATYGFILDDNGNRQEVTLEEPLVPVVSAASIDYTYNAEKNRLLSTGLFAFSYDDEGQLSDRDDIDYTFDAAHRLVASTGTAPCSYAYDGQNNRLQATRNGQITRYIYSASGDLLAEADQNNQILRYYIYGKGLTAMVTAGGQLYCYHFDANANTIALTDSEQNIVNAYAYTPFGLIGNEQEAIEQPFKFVGQFGVMTEPNGFYYMKARYYDPQVGRFISEDPMGFEGGDFNLFVYASNNPILFIDPWGLCSQNLSLGERIGQQVQWQVQVSGLTNLPGIAKETTQILAAAGIGLGAYAAYPAAMVAAGTPAGQKIITEFIPSMNPGTAPLPTYPYGFWGWATGTTIETIMTGN